MMTINRPCYKEDIVLKRELQEEYKKRQLGDFGVFPDEVREKILSCLPAGDLGEMVHSIAILKILGRPLLGQRCTFDGIEEGKFARWFDFSGQSLVRLKLIHPNIAFSINLWTQLENLKFHDAIQGVFPFTRLSFCTRVKVLDLSGTNPEKNDLNFISKLIHLNSLDLSGNILTYETQRSIQNNTLTRLSVNGCAIEDLNFLNQLPYLKALNIAAGILNAGLREVEDCKILAKFTNLTSLNLQNTKVPEEGLMYLASLTNLTSLNLQNCHHLTDDNLKQLAKLTALKVLDFSYCKQISDAGLMPLTNLVNLTYLNLYRCRLKNKGLQYFLSEKITEKSAALLKNLKSDDT